MNEVIALAERVSGGSLNVAREAAATGDVRRTKADVTKAGAEALRLVAADHVGRRHARSALRVESPA